MILKKRETFNDERWDVAFYCKDCEEIVETDRKILHDIYLYVKNVVEQM